MYKVFGVDWVPVKDVLFNFDEEFSAKSLVYEWEIDLFLPLIIFFNVIIKFQCYNVLIKWFIVNGI